MDFDYKRRVIRVVYFSFVDNGGMLHYAQNLAIAYGEIAESSMVVMGAGKNLVNIVAFVIIITLDLHVLIDCNSDWRSVNWRDACGEFSWSWR